MNPIDMDPTITTLSTIEAPVQHFTVVPAMTTIPTTHYYETGPPVSHVEYYETHHY